MNDANPPALQEAAAAPVRPTMAALLRHSITYGRSHTFDGPTAAIGATLMICVIAVVGAAGPTWVAALVVAVFLVILTASLLIGGWELMTGEPARIAESRTKEEAYAREGMAGRYNAMVPTQHPRWMEQFAAITKIRQDEAAHSIASDMSIRIRNLHAAFEDAIRDAGRSDTSGIRTEAASAAIAIMDDAMSRHHDLDRALRHADEARTPEVERRFAQAARTVAGLPSVPDALPPPSASAALQRLIGLAEDALGEDPDLMDAGGNRVDDLVRRHLPRLLERHADAARSPSSDLASVDGQLAVGVEEVRASIEEALNADARERFQRLSDEVRFLKMRRGE